MTENTVNETISQDLDNRDWRVVERYFNDSEFAERFGINVVLLDPNKPKCEINEIKAFHLGGIGQDYINGAVISAMFDLAIGLTGLKYASIGNFATSSVNIRLLKPVEKNRFYIVAQINKKYANRLFSEATLFNHRDEPCGYANGEVRVAIK